jgi:hypothetical protein
MPTRPPAARAVFHKRALREFETRLVAGWGDPDFKRTPFDPSAPTTIYAGTLGGGVFDYEMVLAVRSPPILPPNRRGIPRLVNPRR